MSNFKKKLSENKFLKILYAKILFLNLKLFSPIKHIAYFLQNFKFFRRIKFIFLLPNKLFLENIDNIKFFINSSDIVNSKKIFINKKFPQINELKIAFKLLQEKGFEVNTFIDVGSHYGNIIIPALKIYNISRGYCFEPIPENYEILKLNILINQLDKNITPYNLFISDNEEKVTMKIYGNNSAAATKLVEDNLNAYENINNLTYERIFETASTRLDSIINQNDLDAPLFWIYAQGQELKILISAEKLLYNSPPLVVAYTPLLNLKNNIESDQFINFFKKNKYNFVTDLNNDVGIFRSIETDFFKNLDYKLFNSSSARLLLFIK